VLISYGASARPARDVVEYLRSKGQRLGLLELQTLWPFPASIVREKCKNAREILVVEMNMGQIKSAVESAVGNPDKVYLANRIDGELITPTNIRTFLRIIWGKGV
jgi:2-oxoglutarate ferredoxin oxidoreductase subunit alpha